MLHVLSNPVFRRLFLAQAIALLGTGLLTIALGLLAWEIAGAEAGAVLGTALAIKMVAYVVLSPVMAAAVARLPRRGVLVAADLARAGVAVFLPFVTEVWQVYLLIFLLQTASATFTPAFQAVIPDVLPEEEDYTRALSLSRLAYDLESLASPMLAAALLLVIGFHWLFLGTVAGFVLSALLVLTTRLPERSDAERPRPFTERLTRGARIYLATPRLRGLLALNVGGAAVGAFVIVNKVVVMRDLFGMGESAVAVAFAAYGAGSMAGALLLPGVLERRGDRGVMLAAGGLMAGIGLLAGVTMAAGGLTLPVFLGLWAVLGLGYAGIMTPGGRLLRRSAHDEDRPAIFAAQFALSHSGWLVTYPLAGWAGTVIGLGPTLLMMGGIAGVAALIAGRVWREAHEGAVAHDHPDLPPDHPHLQGHGGPGRHAHAVIIDDAHHVWPTQG